MGIDGFSMGNLGLNSELTSAQMTTQAEQIALKDSEIKIKDVTEQAESGEVKQKDKDEEEQNFSGDNPEEKQEDNEDLEKNEYLDENFFENKNSKDFLLRLNYKTKLIELYNKKNNKVFGTIKAQDLMNIMSKLDNVSGFLINRKI